MRQAITTKYLGPTDFRGPRVKATCDAGSTIVAWDDALNPDQNHERAANHLARRLGWLTADKHGQWSLKGGGTRSGFAFVLVLRKAGK